MTLDSSAYYAVTVDGYTGRGIRGPWAALVIADAKRRGLSGSFRQVEAPPRRVATTHAFGSPDGRRRCGARGMLSTEPTCADCRRELRR